MPDRVSAVPARRAALCALTSVLMVASAAIAQTPAIPKGVVAPAPAPSADGVIRATLDNGLRVLLRPLPVSISDEVAVVVLFDFGESSDPEGKSGMAHLVEHLYLTAAAGDAPSRTYEELSSKYMQQMNAQTGEDYTLFAGVVPAQSLGDELKDAAARLVAPKVEQADLDREKPRITRELANMYGAMPPLAARNQARALARPAPEGARKGGVIEQVNAITLEDVRERLRYYKPKNATLSIAGGFDPDTTLVMVREIFGAISAGEASPPRRPRPEAKAEAPLVLPLMPAGIVGAAVVAFDSPPPGAPHFAATTLLVARMQAKLLPPGAPRQIQLPPVTHPVLDDPNVVFLAMPMGANETADAAAARIDAMIEDAVKADVTPAEIQQQRASLGAFLGITPLPEETAAMNLYGAAFSVGRREQMGFDPAALGKALDGLTAADLRACREAHFTPAKRACVALVEMPKAP